MSIVFETVDAPTKATEKDITKNDYWQMIDTIKDAKGTNGGPQAAKFTIPTQDGDDYKRATGRVRSKLNEVSDHLGRTIRATFTPERDVTDVKDIRAEVWVMDKKIKRVKKDATPTETAPTDTQEQAPTDTQEQAPTVTNPFETPAETETEKPARKNRKAA